MAAADLSQRTSLVLDRRPLEPDPRPGLYVHVPFCARICPYCDFSVVGERHPGRTDYVNFVLREADAWRNDSSVGEPTWGDPHAFGTVYFGGGTPSALDPDERSRLVVGLRERLPIAEDARWTFEANPEHIDAEFARQLVELGIDHVSLGVQSLDRDVLRQLGRAHRPVDVENAVVALRDAGVVWISVDLIYAVRPILDGWAEELEAALRLQPDHMSCYELTIHDGTRFGREVASGLRGVVDEDLRYQMFVLTVERLRAGGYELYEVSNFARGISSRSPHNQKYWTGTPYLGLGPSAHSFGEGRRWWNRRSLRDWRRDVMERGRAVDGHETLGLREILFERLLTGTRTAAGVDLTAIREELGVDLAHESSSAIERLRSLGRIELLDDARRLAPTVTGLATADQLAVDLFPEGRG